MTDSTHGRRDNDAAEQQKRPSGRGVRATSGDGDVRTGGGTGHIGGGASGAGDDDVGTGMGTGGGSGVGVSSGVVSAGEVSREQMASGRLVLNRDYSTGDTAEAGTGGGDVGIGGDVSPHGRLHEVDESAFEVQERDEDLAAREGVDEGGYLEKEGEFPPEQEDYERELE